LRIFTDEEVRISSQPKKQTTSMEYYTNGKNKKPDDNDFRLEYFDAIITEN
jgi:hypothetical protein